MDAQGMCPWSPGAIPQVLTRWASLGGADWPFRWAQVPFSLASFFFMTFFLHRTLSWLLEVLPRSIHILIFLEELAINLFTTMSTACWVVLRCFQCWHGDVYGAFLFDVCSISFLIDAEAHGEGTAACPPQGLGNTLWHLSTFPFCSPPWRITGSWWF